MVRMARVFCRVKKQLPMKKFLSGIFLFAMAAITDAQINVSGDITTNTTWTSNNIYILDGWVYVKAGATLTIEPGTIIKGDFVDKGALIIERDAMIMAEGTAQQPIVFTSQKAVGERTYGDWGGLIICGRAAVNAPANAGNGTAAGEAIIEGGVGSIYGGGTNPDNADNSGVLRYVRIEYGGIPFQPNSEINGLTLGGVGSGTTIDHIQVSYCGDDAYEMFGGTVNLSNIIAYRNWDDDFDTDFGYQGKVQFALSVRDPLIADQSGSNGFESDNDATGTANTPFTRGIFSNVTIIGPSVNGTPASNYKRALHLRRNTQTSVFNSVFVGYPTGLLIDGSSTHTNAANGDLRFRNSVVCQMNDSLATATSADPNNVSGSFNITSWYNTTGFSNSLANGVSELMFSNHSLATPDLTLMDGSMLLTGADFSNSYLADTFFETVNFRGAFGQDNWASCWAEWNPQSQLYNSAINNAVTAIASVNGGENMVCPGENFTIQSSTNIASPMYMWSNGESTANITTDIPGTYTVWIESANGCSATSNEIVVGNYTAPEVSITADGSTTFCTGGSVTLTSSAMNGIEWSNGMETMSIVVQESGSYDVTYTDANGCEANSNIINVSVSDSPAPTVSANGNTEICEGSSVQLAASPSDTYQWYFNGNMINDATEMNYEATASGAYYVSVTNADQCDGTGNSSNVFVTVNPQPTAMADYTSNFGSYTIQFINNSTLATEYLWDFGDGQTSTQANPQHTYSGGGNFTVTLTATNGDCADVFELEVMSVAVDENEFSENFSLFPNPTNGNTTLELMLNSVGEVQIDLFDMNGKIVLSESAQHIVGSLRFTLPTEVLESGIYFVNIQVNENRVHVLKLVVK